MHSYQAECQKQLCQTRNEKPVSVQQFLVALVDIDFHTERNLKKKGEEENREIVSILSGIPGARAKQTVQINCFSDTGAHSIKVNQIASLSSVTLSGLFAALTTSWSVAPLRLSSATGWC